MYAQTSIEFTWSYLDQKESLACQIASPFNKEMGCYWKAIFFILFKNQPGLLLNWEVILQASVSSLSKDLHANSI